jgi:hypothetical protein
MWAESKVDVGSTLHFTLPAEPTDLYDARAHLTGSRLMPEVLWEPL